MTRRTVLGALVATSALALLALGRRATAATPRAPTLELTVIHAVQSDGGPGSVDKQLKDLSNHLREKPFSSYNVFRELDHKSLSLDKPASYRLANGQVLEVKLTSVVDPDAGTGGAGSHEKRYQLDTQIVDPADAAKAPVLKAHVTASDNEPFWLWLKQSFQGGSLLLELVVRP